MTRTLLLCLLLPPLLPAQDHFGKPVAFWLERLQSKDLLERDEALQVFARLGPAGRAAVPHLKPLLKDAKAGTRVTVAFALWDIQGSGADAVPTLAQGYPKLADAEKARVVERVLAVKKVDAALFDMLAVLMDDPKQATRVVYHVPTLGAEAAPHYAKWIEAKTGKDRANYILATPFVFVHATKGAIVAKYLKDADPHCQAGAAAVLATVPARRAEAVAALIDLGTSKNQAAADVALWNLAQLRPVPARASPILLAGLKHADLKYRMAAAPAVLALHPDKGEDVVPVLADALESKNPNDRYQAYPLLAGLGKQGEQLVPKLLERLRDPSSFETAAVLQALTPHAGRVGKEVGELTFATPANSVRFQVPQLREFAPHFLDQIAKHLEGDDVPRKQLALRLARVYPLAVRVKLVPAFVKALQDDAQAQLALEALEMCRKAASAAAPEVFAACQRPNGQRLLGAVRRTLSQIEPAPKDIEPMLATLKAKESPGHDERLLAAELCLLHPERSKEAVAWLEPILAKPGGNQFDAFQMLDRLGPEAVQLVPLLRARLKGNGYALNTYYKLLVRLGPAAREVMPEVLEALAKPVDAGTALRAALVVYAVAPEQRAAADAALVKVLTERLAAPQGNEVNSIVSDLVQLAALKPGLPKALAPVLAKLLTERANDDQRADLIVPLTKLDAAAGADLFQLLEGNLGAYPSASRGAILGVLRVRPDHPKALAELKEFFTESRRETALLGLDIAARCERPLPGVRAWVEAYLKGTTTFESRYLAYLTLMRYDGKLNPQWVDEIVANAEHPAANLSTLRTLGALGKPLVPRLRLLRVNEFKRGQLHDAIDALDRAE